MSNPFFPIERLRLFAADQQIYRAFHYLIATRMGTLLLVPLHLVTGRCDAVVDGCPVPWEEVHAVLEYPPVHKFTNPSNWNWRNQANHINKHFELLMGLGIDPGECEMDHITPMVNGDEKVLRLVHPCGVRYAVVMSNIEVRGCATAERKADGRT